MFVQISPSDQDLGETMSSLNFATRVRGIELGPVKKQVDTSELQKTKLMVGILIFSLFHNFFPMFLTFLLLITTIIYLFNIFISIKTA